MRFTNLCVLAAGVLLGLFSASAYGQVSLVQVPSCLPGYEDLSQQREKLVTERAHLQTLITEHNQKTAPEDTPAAERLRLEGAQLREMMQGHVAASKAFNASVAAAADAFGTKEAGQRVGAVAVHRGEFSLIMPDGRKYTGDEAAEAPVGLGTRIVTGSNGRIQVLLLDETVFTVGPNCDLVIDEFVYDPDTSMDKVTARLLKGVFRWVTGKVARKDPAQMKVILPAGYTGIRGTDFEAMVAPDGSGSVTLYSGQLEIMEKKTQRTFLLNAGQMITFSAEGIFASPAPLDPAIARL